MEVLHIQFSSEIHVVRTQFVGWTGGVCLALFNSDI